MKSAALLLCLAAFASLTGGCQQGDKPAGKAQADGEILPGSASDAMLPLDTVRSQPPLAPPPRASGAADGAETDGAAAAATDAPAAAASDAAPASADAAPTPAAE